jgi:hypothetical protein
MIPQTRVTGKADSPQVGAGRDDAGTQSREPGMSPLDFLAESPALTKGGEEEILP